MRTIKCIFTGGGPLDGRVRPEFIPNRYQGLRVEHQAGTRLYVYFGLVDASDQAELRYQGAHAMEEHAQ